MIKYQDAIRVARQQLGTPYGTRPGELDCINLIKLVIRTAPGGVPGYTTAGVNSLWDSYGMSAKYRDLTWRQESLSGARAGMIAFKRYGKDDEGHAGIVTDAGTVIHASSQYGMTVETELSEKDGWDLLAVHRYIQPAPAGAETEVSVKYKANVKLNNPGSTLNVRTAPVDGNVIGKLHNGAPVDVLVESGGWAFIRYGDSGTGYVSAAYLERAEEEPEIPKQGEAGLTVQVVITDEAGNTFRPVGIFTVDIEMALDGEPLEESESID